MNSKLKIGGISFTGLLTVLFTGLKLTGFINWAWLWVLSPLWIGLAVGLSLALIAAIIIVIACVWALNSLN